MTFSFGEGSLMKSDQSTSAHRDRDRNGTAPTLEPYEWKQEAERSKLPHDLMNRSSTVGDV